MTFIAGYRTLRRLGAGDRCEVWLGRPLADQSGGEAGSIVGKADDAEFGSDLVALKVFRPEVPAASIDSELRVLLRLDHPHIVPVLDVATTAALAPCLVLPRYEPGGLTRLLSAREALHIGEVVTVVAPLCSAISEMHDALVSHGSIGVGSVLLSEDGAPVLVGFGSAKEIDGRRPATPAVLASDKDFRGDRLALSALTRVLLGKVVGERGAGGLEDWLASDATASPAFAAELADRLFDLADPSPVSYTDRAPDAARARPLELRGQMSATISREAEEHRDGLHLRFLGVPGSLADAADVAVDSVVRAARAAWQALALVRRRYFLLGSVAVLCGALAVGLLVADQEDAETAADESAAVVPAEALPRQEAPAEDRGTVDGADAPPNLDSAAILSGDDAAAAGVELLRVRSACIAEGSVTCLEAIVHGESPVLLSDAETIMATQRGEASRTDRGSQPWAPNALELVDQMGSAVLLREPAVSQSDANQLGAGAEPGYSHTASLLIVRSEAVWKIRDIYEI
ncbi:protein kinase domain-containing protein [Salinibacterium hongtaonis]|uniref:protein kinase domain-containing protein n=1 Tax=Homoserinimonas hongtaonis TaxID=2079791 RepID=UPI000D347297|nr:protein kinase [Salinibacterium hongtaonis]AWB89339.1 hypothetical protein C2138_07120 [Salinibacterium hongtaonis]